MEWSGSGYVAVVHSPKAAPPRRVRSVSAGLRTGQILHAVATEPSGRPLDVKALPLAPTDL